MHSPLFPKEIEETEKEKRKTGANEFYYTVMMRERKRTNGRRPKKRKEKDCFVRRRYS